MKFRFLGLALLSLAGVAHLVFLLPARREVATLQAEFARVRVSREAKRRQLAVLESERRRSGGSTEDPVAMALGLRPGLVACLERSGLSEVEFGFQGDSASRLRLRAAGVGRLPEILESLDCAVSDQAGIVSDRVSLSRASAGLRLELAGSPGHLLASPDARREALTLDPFGSEAGGGVDPGRPVTGRAPSTVDEVTAAPPIPQSLEPTVRLVGFVRRGGKICAALSIRGEVVVAAVGESAAGYSVVSADPASGVEVTDPSGVRIRLALAE